MSNERPLQPGDLVQLVWVKYPENKHLVGVEFVLGEGPMDLVDVDGNEYVGFYSTLTHYANGPVDIRQVRRIPPKSDPVSTYTDQFTPASPEWVEDLKRSLKIQERVS